MQPNEITLAVDEANDGNPVNYVWKRQDWFNNRSVYTGPEHSTVSRCTMGFYRTAPKTSGNFRGVAKGAVKFTLDRVVLGVDGLAQLTSPMILEIGFSLPVGVTLDDQMILRQVAVALLDNDTVCEALMANQEI